MPAPKNGTRRERHFASVMARRGIAVERPRGSFVFRWTCYRPDFYSPSENVYYEVIGSRQRFATIAPLLDLMAIVYPAITLKVVDPDGREKEPGIVTRLQAHVRAHIPFREALIEKARAEGLTIREISGRSGINPRKLYGNQKFKPDDVERLRTFVNGGIEAAVSHG